jgi:signal transduction histidine kinase
MFMVNGLVFTILNEHIDKVLKIVTIERGKLRSLALRLSITEERQRQYIAAGLHDSVGQKLSAAKILAQTMRKKNIIDTSEHMDKVIDYLDSSIIEIRELIFKLSPKVLYEFGLNAAIETLIESFEQDSSLKFHYRYTGPTKILNREINSSIFRIIRELFINISKHAKAHNVYIEIEADDDRLDIVIKDDGNGFNVSEVLEGDKITDRFGLFNIQQQLADINGQILIESEAGAGTKVSIFYPLRTTESNFTNAGNYIIS